MYVAFLVVTIVISVLLMLSLPFLAREACRTDRVIPPMFRRFYYISVATLVEVALSSLVILVALLFDFSPLPSSASPFDTIFLSAWACFGVIMVIFCLVVVSQTMNGRRQA